MLGRSVESVYQQRRALNIPLETGTGRGRPWSKSEDNLLGKKSDAEVARLTGRTVGAVQHHRAQKYGPRRNLSCWARTRTGRSPSESVDDSVSRKRRALGIKGRSTFDGRRRRNGCLGQSLTSRLLWRLPERLQQLSSVVANSGSPRFREPRRACETRGIQPCVSSFGL